MSATLDQGSNPSTWITESPTNTTTVAPDCDTIPHAWGFVAAVIAVFFYGTNFAPVKKYETGDGLFFQLVMSIAAWCVALVVNMIRDSPTFHPIAMLGGMFWATGNLCVVPIVKCIGLGLGLCVWSLTNLLSGWATGRFGLFGLTPDQPDNKLLNDLGVILAISSVFIFAMVKNEVSTSYVEHTHPVDVNISEKSPLVQSEYVPTTSDHSKDEISREIVVIQSEQQSDSEKLPVEEPEVSPIDKLSPRYKITLGFTLSLASGLLYGQFFTPTFYVIDHPEKYPGASQNALDYVYATLSGGLLGSTVYFVIVAAFRRNKPQVYPRVILPGMVCGTMWAIATACWFVANKVLSEAVAFPIVTTGPGIVASLCGVFIFGEIKGFRNILILCVAIAVTLTGAILTAFSKKATKSSC